MAKPSESGRECSEKMSRAETSAPKFGPQMARSKGVAKNVSQ
jgi:hypothetical protein